MNLTDTVAMLQQQFRAMQAKMNEAVVSGFQQVTANLSATKADPEQTRAEIARRKTENAPDTNNTNPTATQTPPSWRTAISSQQLDVTEWPALHDSLPPSQFRQNAPQSLPRTKTRKRLTVEAAVPTFTAPPDTHYFKHIFVPTKARMPVGQLRASLCKLPSARYSLPYQTHCRLVDP